MTKKSSEFSQFPPAIARVLPWGRGEFLWKKFLFSNSLRIVQTTAVKFSLEFFNTSEVREVVVDFQ
jgi:hypothetical protein